MIAFSITGCKGGTASAAIEGVQTAARQNAIEDKKSGCDMAIPLLPHDDEIN
ncbi:MULTISPECIES: hypothetical protein [unclassified Rhizobium]|uniref:hypothetical protein n=1 Tax=unclassified Rhizobium TaxID=2613769 RepID=UPI0012E2514A|nr:MULTISPECIES: hypothetical protein [unclassified Rhizobium]